MTDTYKKFLETFESPNMLKVVKSMQVIGDYNYSNCTQKEVEDVVLKLNPSSPRAVTTICSVFRQYAKFLNDDHLYFILENIDRNAIWESAKPKAKRKFISHAEFEDICHSIDMFEEFNAFYHQMLFRCLYEGIYNGDMSVIENLKASDIHGNIVTLRDNNGDTFDLEVSEKFARDLRELSMIEYWERRNRVKVSKMKMTGKYFDSCFKTVKRKDFSKYSYRYTYYRILRKISEDYLEFNLLPIQLYISGIMYRIILKLNEYDIKLEEAWSTHNRDKLVHNIIEAELKRCNYDISVNNFRELTKGHLEIFSDI